MAGEWCAAHARMDASATSAQYLPLSLHLLLFASGLGSERKIVGKRPVDQGASDILLSHLLWVFFSGRIYARERTKYGSLILW